MKSIQKTTPALRFKDEQGKDFPDWEEIRLGDLSNVKRGASPRPINLSMWFDEVSNIGWVRISDVTSSSKYLKKTAQYLSETGVKKSRFIPKGNIIMSICGTIGKPIYTGLDVCIHDGFVVFEKLKVNLEFFFYYLEKFQKCWYRYGQPGIQLNLNTNIVSNEKIKIPIDSEQQKIASFLSSIDTKIEQLGKKKVLLEQYKKGMMQKLFSQEISFKDEQGNHFTEWKSVALSDTKSPEKHSFTGGPFGSNLKREDYTKEGIRVIQLQNIGDGIFIDDHKIYTSIAKADQLKSCNIFPGEIIVSKMGDPVARACLIPTNKDERYLMASDGIRLSVNSKKYDCKFVLDSINQSSFRRKAISHSTGSTRKRITLPDLRSLRIFVPQFKEQQKIADFLSVIDKKIELIAQQLEQARTFKKGLLQRMFI